MLAVLKRPEISPLPSLPSMVSSPKLSSLPESGRTKRSTAGSSVISAELTTLLLASCHNLTSRSNDAESPQAQPFSHCMAGKQGFVKVTVSRADIDHEGLQGGTG